MRRSAFWTVASALALFTAQAAAADESRVVMNAQATPEQVAKMNKTAAESGPSAFKAEHGMGSFAASPKDGGYRLTATVIGERKSAHAGATEAQVVATVGDESGGKVYSCSAKEDAPRTGPVRLTCDMEGAFNVKDAKPVFVKFGLGRVQGFDAQAVGVQALTGGAKSGVWLIGKLVPLLTGLAMLGYWFFFIRR